VSSFTSRKSAPLPMPENQTPISFTRTDIPSSDKELSEFTDQMTNMIKRRDFVGLEAVARAFRTNRERFIGGGWKIHSFYVLTSTPMGERIGEAEWRSHIKYLQDWKKAIPRSVAARCSLAKAYIGFAWFARGGTYASKVPDSAWPSVGERLAAAFIEARQVAQLTERCYGYFEVLLDLGTREAWPRAEFDAAFNQAVSYDPTYQYFYEMKAENLMPRWDGSPGEWESFANKTRETIGGDEGLKMYYRIVAAIGSYYPGFGFFDANIPSWEHMKLGFLLTEHQYGLTRNQLNQFARLAFESNDAQATCETFRQFADDTDADPSSVSVSNMYRQLKKIVETNSCVANQNPRQAGSTYKF
jgi:hypothetical protein